jgi:hypothetical protein
MYFIFLHVFSSVEKGGEAASTNSNSSSSTATADKDKEDRLLRLIDTTQPVAQVAGILPGIGSYQNDSSSDSSSAESDIEDYLPQKKIKVSKIQK